MGLEERIAANQVRLPRVVEVLIVEDQPLVAAVTRDMVESIGGTVVAVAGTIAAALEACATRAFDVALLDVDLAGASSAPVADALVRAGTPFLIVTGADEVPDAFGDRPVLAKPYMLRALCEALVSILP